MNDSQHLIVIFTFNFMTALMCLVLRITTYLKDYEYASLEFNLVIDTIIVFSTIHLCYMAGIVIYELCAKNVCIDSNRNGIVSRPSS